MYSFFKYLMSNGYKAKFVTNTLVADDNVIIIKKYSFENYLWKISPIAVFLSSFIQIAFRFLAGNFKSTDSIRAVWLVSVNPMAAAAGVLFSLAGYRIITQNVLMDSDNPGRRPSGKLRIAHKLRTLQYYVTDTVTSNSPGLYEISKAHHPNCIMIPNPVDMPDTRIRNKPRSIPNVLSIGRLCHRKGTDIAFKTINIVHRSNPEVKFTFVGPYDETDIRVWKIYETCKNINRDNVCFAGYQTDTRSWYMNADIFFFPSRNEGLPSVVIEAMSFGIPVVAKKLEGSTDYIFDNGYPLLINSEYPEKYADEILKLISNTRFYKLIARYLHLNLSRFDKEKIYKSYIKLCIR